MTKNKIDTKRFVKRVLKETCEVNFPKFLFITFKELKKECPDEWTFYIFDAIHKVEQEDSRKQNVSEIPITKKILPASFGLKNLEMTITKENKEK